ncbi:MAG: hypothetical protein ACR2PV_07155, partial [Gammaproteobacteria bacterium]
DKPFIIQIKIHYAHIKNLSGRRHTHPITKFVVGAYAGPAASDGIFTITETYREVEKGEGVNVDTTSLLHHFNENNNPQRCPLRDIQFSKEQISNVRGEIEARYNNIKEKHNEWLEGNSCGWMKDMTY